MQLLLALLGVAVGVAAVVAVGAARQAVEDSFSRNLQALEGSVTHRLVAVGGVISMATYVELRSNYPLLPMAPVIRERARLIPAGKPHADDFQRVTILGVDLISEAEFSDQKSPNTGLLPGIESIDIAAWLGGEPLALIPAGISELVENERLDLFWRGQQKKLTVAGQLNQKSSIASDVIVVDIAFASRWFARNGLDSIRLRLTPEQVEVLTANLPDGLELRGNSDQSGLSAAFSLNLVAMGLLTLLMGVLMVFSTFRLLLLQREPLIRLQHAIGSNPLSQVIDAFTEAILIGLLGTVIGLLAGLGLAQLVIGWIQQTLSDLWVTGFNDSIRLTRGMVIQAVLAGLGGSMLAIAPLLWRIYKTGFQVVDPAANKNRWPILMGTLLVILAIILLFGSGGLLLALAGLFSATMGYLLLTIPLLAVLAKLIRYLFNWQRYLGVVAARRLLASLRHTTPALVALTLAVASIIGIGSMVNSFRSSVTDWMDVSLSATAYIGAEGQELPKSLLDQVANWPEVNAVGWLNTVSIQLADYRAELSIVELPEAGQNSYRILDGQSLWQIADQSASMVMVGETLAARRNLKSGQTVSFTLAEQGLSVTARVAGVFQDYRAGPGRMVMLRTALSNPPVAPAALGVYLNDPGQFGLLRQQLDRLPDLPLEVEVISATEVKAETLRIFDQTFLLTRSLRWIVALVALVGITGALLALQLERQAELQLLQRLGLNDNEQRRLMLYEAGLLGLVAILLALPLGSMLAWMLCEVINQRAFGWHITVLLLPEHYLLAAAIGMLATLLAGWLCIRISAASWQQQHATEVVTV